jgi:hypothetical protein
MNAVKPPGGDPALKRLLELAFGAGVAAAIQAAARLGLADLVGEEPILVEDLAEAADANSDTLYRLLRALASYGVFEEVDERRFSHTDPSRLLRKDTPGSLLYMTLWLGAPWTWQAWPRLDQAISGGEPVIPGIFGKDFYSYLKEDAPDSEDVFARAMTQSSALSSQAVVEALDITGVRTVVDIGGGQGHLIRTLLRRHSHLRGMLFDLETVVANAYPELREDGELGPRCQIVGGSCLESMPVKADMYLLKNLLDWPDEFSILTLRNILAAAPPGARVVVVDNIVDHHPEEMKITTLVDLLLLLNVGGQRHTKGDFEKLFTRAGIEVTGVTSVPGTVPALHLVEGRIPGGK